jgi:hypothetical protein
MHTFNVIINLTHGEIILSEYAQRAYQHQKTESDPYIDNSSINDINSTDFFVNRTNLTLIKIIKCLKENAIGSNCSIDIVELPIVFLCYFTICKYTDKEIIQIDFLRFRSDMINKMLGSYWSDDVKLRIIARINNLDMDTAKMYTITSLVDGSIEPTESPRALNAIQPTYFPIIDHRTRQQKQFHVNPIYTGYKPKKIFDDEYEKKYNPVCDSL